MKQDFVARTFVVALAALAVFVGRLIVLPVIAVFATVASLIIKDRVRYTDSNWFSTLVFLFPMLCAVRSVVPHYTEDTHWILPAGILLSLAEFFLLTMSLEFFRDRGKSESQNGHVLPIHFPVWGLGVLICLMHRSYIDVGARLAMFGAAFVGVALAAMFFQLNRFERVRRYRQRHASDQFRPLILVLAISGLLSWQSYEVWAKSNYSIARWLIDNYHEKLNEKNTTAPVAGHLTAVTSQRLRGAERILFRGHSDIRPLYLRSDVFTQYDGNRWHKPRSSPTRYVQPLVAMANAPSGLEESLRTSTDRAFVISENPNFDVLPYSTVSINGNRSGGEALVPLGISYATGSPSQSFLGIDDTGILTRGFNVQHRYTYFLPHTCTTRIATSHRNDCLVLSNRHSTSDTQRIALLSRYVTADCESVEAKVVAVEDYLTQNYELAVTAPESSSAEDKVFRFLLDKQPATCEYFASAATLLLRASGVPARYVTGYAPRVSANRRWSIADRDSHAWSEAYDDVSRTWITVEATPGKAAYLKTPTSQRPARPVGNRLETDDSVVSQRNERAVADRRFRRRLGALSDRRIQAMLALCLIAALLLWKRYLEADPHPARSWLASVERQLSRHQLNRRSGETLNQFADRVRAYPYGHKHNPPLSALADWLKHYAQFRYAELPPEWIQPPPSKSDPRRHAGNDAQSTA